MSRMNSYVAALSTGKEDEYMEFNSSLDGRNQSVKPPPRYAAASLLAPLVHASDYRSCVRRTRSDCSASCTGNVDVGVATLSKRIQEPTPCLWSHLVRQAIVNEEDESTTGADISEPIGETFTASPRDASGAGPSAITVIGPLLPGWVPRWSGNRVIGVGPRTTPITDRFWWAITSVCLPSTLI